MWYHIRNDYTKCTDSAVLSVKFLLVVAISAYKTDMIKYTAVAGY